MRKIPWLIVPFVGILILALTTNEVFAAFTALVTMEEFLNSQKYLLQCLRDYIIISEDRLTKLKIYLEELEAEYKVAARGIREYLSNPMNAFLFTKRMTVDWNEVEILMFNDLGHAFLHAIEHKRETEPKKFPNYDDLNGAAMAIGRLQLTYKLTSRSLAEGKINEVQYRSALSSSDCFELGKQLNLEKEYYLSLLWMTEAFHRYHTEVNKTANLVDIVEYLAYDFYSTGIVNVAYNLTSRILLLDPHHERAQTNLNYYRKILDDRKKNGTNLLEHKKNETLKTQAVIANDSSAAPQQDESESDWDLELTFENYEKMCRSEVTATEQVKATLKCRYVDFGRPFLKLARLKEEELYLDPRIVMYHEVISDKEIEAIKLMSIPNLRRAGVNAVELEESIAPDYRISEVAWLDDFDHPRVAAISRRVSDMTGMNMEKAEKLQVLNYGIAGHYEPHYDFTEPEQTNTLLMRTSGGRIATVLFYMNDVLEGGATVFPLLNVTIWPRKGSAAFWFNLLKNGIGDYKMRHAACPVLLGSKWVCTKWLHERGQEFLKPCGLHPEERNF